MNVKRKLIRRKRILNYVMGGLTICVLLLGLFSSLHPAIWGPMVLVGLMWYVVYLDIVLHEMTFISSDSYTIGWRNGQSSMIRQAEQTTKNEYTEYLRGIPEVLEQDKP